MSYILLLGRVRFESPAAGAYEEKVRAKKKLVAVVAFVMPIEPPYKKIVTG